MVSKLKKINERKYLEIEINSFTKRRIKSSEEILNNYANYLSCFDSYSHSQFFSRRYINQKIATPDRRLQVYE